MNNEAEKAVAALNEKERLKRIADGKRNALIQNLLMATLRKTIDWKSMADPAACMCHFPNQVIELYQFERQATESVRIVTGVPSKRTIVRLTITTPDGNPIEKIDSDSFGDKSLAELYKAAIREAMNADNVIDNLNQMLINKNSG